MMSIAKEPPATRGVSPAVRVADTPATVDGAAFDAAAAAVEAALAAGARYADARLVDRRHETMTARNGDVRSLTRTTSAGLGVRALVGFSWGFAALGDPAGIRSAAARARSSWSKGSPGSA
jgi:predicted Zn-dependent protease